jgi:hypothetical protein
MSLTDAKSRLLRPAAIRNVRHLASAVPTIRNWPTFVIDYVPARDAPRCYTMRSGIQIQTREAIDLPHVGVVFLGREYDRRDWTAASTSAPTSASSQASRPPPARASSPTSRCRELCPAAA